MAETSVHKVNSSSSPKGRMGQKYLACGVSLGMRLWENVQVGNDHPESVRDYETAGYVINGRAELHLGNQTLMLEPGDSWIVPRGAHHSYRILEPFTAVEATHPPSVIHNRDEPSR
jgi:quercetin dioxygenase-like cupin family protein